MKEKEMDKTELPEDQEFIIGKNLKNSKKYMVD